MLDGCGEKGTLMHCCGIPDGSDDKKSACSAQNPGFSLCREDPLKKGMATHSSW